MKRSKWKGIYVKPGNYKDQKTLLIKISRNSLIIPKFVGQSFHIHNGKSLKKIKVTKEMLGHKLGEFYKTRANFEYKKKKKKKSLK